MDTILFSKEIDDVLVTISKKEKKHLYSLELYCLTFHEIFHYKNYEYLEDLLLDIYQQMKDMENEYKQQQDSLIVPVPTIVVAGYLLIVGLLIDKENNEYNKRAEYVKLILTKTPEKDFKDIRQFDTFHSKIIDIKAVSQEEYDNFMSQYGWLNLTNNIFSRFILSYIEEAFKDIPSLLQVERFKKYSEY